jgi:two-component system, OmpR family, response regulator
VAVGCSATLRDNFPDDCGYNASMATTDHILIVDDELELRRLLSDYLQKNGYRVSTAADGKAMQAALDGARVDLIVLDLMLPGEDGLTLCRDLRSRSQVPVIMLTARGEQTDRIVGLEMGADDYVAKPFSPRELLARIKAVLRRTRALPENMEPEEVGRFRFAGWQLDTTTRYLTAPDGVVIPLSGAEYGLLRVFLEHPNRVLSRDQLIDLGFGRDAERTDRSVDSQVSRLRLRLRDDAKEPAFIKTVRAHGYVFAVAVEAAK